MLKSVTGYCRARSVNISNALSASSVSSANFPPCIKWIGTSHLLSSLQLFRYFLPMVLLTPLLPLDFIPNEKIWSILSVSNWKSQSNFEVCSNFSISVPFWASFHLPYKIEFSFWLLYIIRTNISEILRSAPLLLAHTLDALAFGWD